MKPQETCRFGNRRNKKRINFLKSLYVAATYEDNLENKHIGHKNAAICKNADVAGEKQVKNRLILGCSCLEEIATL